VQTGNFFNFFDSIVYAKDNRVINGEEATLTSLSIALTGGEAVYDRKEKQKAIKKSLSD
jgi:hypothetical protein